jgi:hypothetical protein
MSSTASRTALIEEMYTSRIARWLLSGATNTTPQLDRQDHPVARQLVSDAFVLVGNVQIRALFL